MVNEILTGVLRTPEMRDSSRVQGKAAQDSGAERLQIVREVRLTEEDNPSMPRKLILLKVSRRLGVSVEKIEKAMSSSRPYE
jgi:hypothetical protein